MESMFFFCTAAVLKGGLKALCHDISAASDDCY